MMKPTRTRFQASGLLFLLAAVTYLDRICISTLAPQISRDLNLSKLDMSFVFSAFAVAYAGFESQRPWGEKIGARRVLARIVIWWSAFMVTAGA
jgi:MFS family permease